MTGNIVAGLAPGLSPETRASKSVAEVSVLGKTRVVKFVLGLVLSVTQVAPKFTTDYNARKTMHDGLPTGV